MVQNIRTHFEYIAHFSCKKHLQKMYITYPCSFQNAELSHNVFAIEIIFSEKRKLTSPTINKLHIRWLNWFYAATIFHK